MISSSKRRPNPRRQERDIAYNKHSPNVTPHNRHFESQFERFQAGKMTDLKDSFGTSKSKKNGFFPSRDSTPDKVNNSSFSKH